MLLEIDGIQIKGVNDYAVSTKDIESGSCGTSETGYEIRDIVRDGVHSIDVKVAGTLDVVSDALQAINKDKISVRFFCPDTGQIETAVMHKASLKSTINFVCGTRGVAETTFSLVEY